ncbi:Gfo/Idh/MocA family protein [Streptococcus dysgalactiae]|uniref:Gfo/Idh/MocA family oxidoreductase n=1 Tax=Streptococcus dysgalactiae subsp. dysgalactiae TaxID=99822 RepID=A0A9X7RXB1_STRDY|nr:Gfo/Idh/MocA family oxidoreductase [Streptococcus dysgalactiae]QGG97595.1 gfo/Idh/MocA family oxidoreductase [Streptococcus dysgalactiae subsp. dysgalactiae]QGH01597.1 gfo/Idh/MocA family oxidoreductase [Streptococcus dysgalactiae subsp. dysgalactiae]
MKLAILGTGMIVKDLLPVLQEIKGIDLNAVVSTPRSVDVARELAKSFAIPTATSDFDSVLASEDVDTVYIATPNHLHYEGAKKALLAGKHVICEKPFTLTAGELDELVVIAKERKLILLEAITNQYLSNMTFIKEHLDQLGDIKIVECNYSQYSSRYDAFKQGDIAPAFDPQKGGGALRDLNIYNIHFVVGLFGSPKKVHYLANMDKGIDTSGMLVMDYEQFKVVCIGAKDCTAEIKSTIQGNKGSLAVLGATNTLPQVQLSLHGHEAEVANLNKHEHRMYEEFLAFRDMIDKRDFEKVNQALEHSRAVMAVLERAVNSQ